MSITVRDITNRKPYTGITPDFIYNRYDLYLEEGQYRVVRISNGERSYEIEYAVINDWCELGIWLTPMNAEELRHLLFHIHKNHPQIKRVTYRNGLVSYGHSVEKNHFRIVLPETVEELEERQSSRQKRVLRKKIRYAEADIGKMSVKEYQQPDIPDEIVNTFYEFKYQTHGRRYDMPPKEYLLHYHVSHAYVLCFGEKVAAVRFSCEQCPYVYSENSAYDPEVKDYYVGKILRDYHLQRMVEKGYKEIYLAGGNYEHKKKYEGIEDIVYFCEIRMEEEDFRDIEKKEPLFERIRDILHHRF